jgi:hypothetical protein
MDINEEIEKILNEIKNNSEYKKLMEDDFDDVGKNNESTYENYNHVVQEAKTNKLITGSLTFDRKLHLTTLGKEIIKNGGWLTHIDNKSKASIRKKKKR